MEMDADELQADAGFVSTGTYFVQQTWSQEKSYKRPYHVNVPTASGGTKAERRRFPVLIFLHGNGGNAKRALQGWLRNRKKIASQYVLVFAQGYREGWNIVSERSKADDGGFIEAVVESLSMYDNVDPDDFTIMGSSNGAALVNQLMIERELPGVRNYVSSVSQLNVWQHDGKHFKKKGVDNNYESVATPVTGRRLLNISGVDDRLVPYHACFCRCGAFHFPVGQANGIRRKAIGNANRCRRKRGVIHLSGR
jgi:poly(3-hydroxybutyrate) depolymerase